jgi:hypothetical protein
MKEKRQKLLLLLNLRNLFNNSHLFNKLLLFNNHSRNKG